MANRHARPRRRPRRPAAYSAQLRALDWNLGSRDARQAAEDAAPTTWLRRNSRTFRDRDRAECLDFQIETEDAARRLLVGGAELAQTAARARAERARHAEAPRRPTSGSSRSAARPRPTTARPPSGRGVGASTRRDDRRHQCREEHFVLAFCWRRERREAAPQLPARPMRAANIEELPSDALHVRVYAGIDPVTKKRHNLIEVLPPGPKTWREAEAARERLLREIAERRKPRTSATITAEVTARQWGTGATVGDRVGACPGDVGGPPWTGSE
jgi:hypothetical protein